jgi:CubicO group peptidase (beta-lactamase class C family)
VTRNLNRRSFLAGATAAAGSAAAAGPIFAWGFSARASAATPALPRIPGLPIASAASVGIAPDISSRIDAFMQRHIDAGNLTGGVTALARRGKLVHFAAHGQLDLEAGTPMTHDRLFRMMSSGKPITGIALLQQIEAGKVSLEDRISKFIPELREFRVRVGDPMQPPGASVQTVPANREITVRDLATHTSGLNGFLLDIPPDVPFTLAARVPYARNIVLDFQPGTRWAYSAVTGPDILARIVEITSGMSFDRYLRERIFEPVEMRDTAFNLTARQRARVVPRYERKGAAWHRAADDNELAVRLLPRTAGPNPIATYFSGSFGLFSTARDCLLFETMLLNEGAIHGRRVLRPESVALMRSNLVGNLYDGGVAYPGSKGTGFGILVRTILDPAACNCGRSKGVFGWAGAYGTTSWTDPLNQLVAVYLVQQRVLAAETEFGQVIADALSLPSSRSVRSVIEFA